LTTSNKTQLKISLANTQPDLGPPLRFVVCINDQEIFEGELRDKIVLEKTIDVIHGDNFLSIEHLDRQDANTKVNNDGVVTDTAMIDIVDLRINKIFFYPDNRTVDKNVFEPKYDNSFVEYARKHDTKSNFPSEVKPTRHIGIMGKQKIYFLWPLHVHAFYYPVHERVRSKV